MVIDLGGCERGQGSVHSVEVPLCGGQVLQCGVMCAFLPSLSVKREDQGPGPDPPLPGDQAGAEREGGRL